MPDNVIVNRIFVLFLLVCVVFQPTASFAREGRRDHHYRYYDHPRFGMRINFISHDYVPVVARGARYYYYDGLYYAPVNNSYVHVIPPVGAIVPTLPSVYRSININGVMYFTDNGIFYVYTRYGYQVVPPPVIQSVSEPVVVMQETEFAEPRNQTKVAEGIGLGAIFGAITGGILGHQMKGHNDVNGALLGGVAGAAAGGIIGAQISNERALIPAAEGMSSANSSNLAPMTRERSLTVDQAESFVVNIPDTQGGYIPVTIKKSVNGYTGPQGEFYSEFPKVSQLQAMYGR